MTIPSPTKNTVRLLIGPPGAGKSTYAQEKLTSKPLKKYVVIDPDDFKPRVRAQFKESGFPYAESEIHEHSIQIALQVYELALREDFDKKIIFSGTGSWLPYMEHLIFLAKQS